MYGFTVADKACMPRRVGGGPDNRNLVRANTEALSVLQTGVFSIAGAVPELLMVTKEARKVMLAPQLALPHVRALLPPSVSKIQANSASAAVKNATGVISTICYKFNCGRHGDAWVQKQNVIASLEKAIDKYGDMFGEKALAYGAT
jgi:hypothetical protein